MVSITINWPQKHNYHYLSMSPAAPIPVPTHIETTPFLPPMRCNSGIRVAICLAPKSLWFYLCILEDGLKQWLLP